MKWLLVPAIPILGLLLVYLSLRAFRGMRTRAFIEANRSVIPRFEAVPCDFVHALVDDGRVHPVLDLIELDPDGNGDAHFLISGGAGQPNGLFRWRDGRVQDVTAEFGLEGPIDQAVYGLLSADVDGDGRAEVLMAMRDTVLVYRQETPGGRYAATQLDFEIPRNQVPISLSAADTRGTGMLDLYVSTYIAPELNRTAIYNDPAIRGENVYLVNLGKGRFEDRTSASGIDVRQNTFQTIWVDIDGSGLPDLVLALNTDRPRMFANLGGGTFEERSLPGGYGFWMGVAAADTSHSGRPDLYFSNVGSSIPAFLVKGDTREDQTIDLSLRHLRNDGDYRFTEIGDTLGSNNKKFGWGVVMEDFVGSGDPQIVVTENYTHYPFNLQAILPSKGSFLVKGKDGRYCDTARYSGVSNPKFGYRALAIDLRGDGRKDLVIANLGGPVRVFLNLAEPNSA